jgi:hypothetical protein
VELGDRNPYALDGGMFARLRQLGLKGRVKTYPRKVVGVLLCDGVRMVEWDLEMGCCRCGQECICRSTDDVTDVVLEQKVGGRDVGTEEPLTAAD